MADEYERAFMGGDGALFSERVRNRYLFLGLGGGTVGALVAGVALAVSSGSIIPALVSAGLGALYIGGLATFFAFARTTVTRERVHIQLGLFGPKIPTASITKIELVSPLAGFGTRSYSIGGTSTVEITWQVGAHARAVLLGTNDARGLMSAIERARGAPPVQVRVAEPEAESAIEDPSEASGEAQGAMRTKG